MSLENSISYATVETGSSARRWHDQLEEHNPGMDSRWMRSLLAIAVVAALTRVALIVVTPHFSPWGDPEDYQVHAASIAAGHGFPLSSQASAGTPSAFRPPGYPYLLGLVYAIAGTHLLAGRLLGVMLGVLAVVLVAYLGRAVWDARVGLLTAVLAAIFLPLIALNGTLLSESLFIPVEIAVAICLVALARAPTRLRWAFLAGALCGVGALTRTVGVTWLLPCLAVSLMAGATGAVRLRSALAIVVAFGLVVTPWTVRNLEAFHAFVPISTQDGFTLAGEYNDVAGRDNALDAVWQDPDQVPSLQQHVAPLYSRIGGVDELQLDHSYADAGLSYIGRHPSQVFIASALNTMRMFGVGPNHQFTNAIAYREMALPHVLEEPTTLSALLVTLVVVLGVLARVAGRLPLRVGPWWLWTIPLLSLLATIPIDGTPRYRVPADPFLLLAATLIVASLSQRILGFRRPQ